MDELLIDDKKYISTKRAAQNTGYAKDYIGQLCREGRVPARLVGRNWYILESAIQDHRFDSSLFFKEQESDKSAEKEEKKPFTSSAWESPRYEAMPFDVLPSVNRIIDSPASIRDENARHYKDILQPAVQNIHEIWDEWFTKTKNQRETATDLASVEAPLDEAKAPEDTKSVVGATENEQMETDSTLEIRALPVGEPKVRQRVVNKTIHSRSPIAVRISAYALSMIALFFAALAAISSGVFDNHQDQLQQASIITGIYIYTMR